MKDNIEAILLIGVIVLLGLTITLIAIPETSIDKEMGIPILTGLIGILAGFGAKKGIEIITKKEGQ